MGAVSEVIRQGSGILSGPLATAANNFSFGATPPFNASELLKGASSTILGSINEAGETIQQWLPEFASDDIESNGEVVSNALQSAITFALPDPTPLIVENLLPVATTTALPDLAPLIVENILPRPGVSRSIDTPPDK